MTEANGLLYMRARYYSPDLMRFINEDIVTGDISNSNSLNRYSYVEGNPVTMVDPFGLEAERIKSAVKSFICGVGYNLLEDIKPLVSLADGYVNSDFVRLKSPYLQCMPPANNGITIYLFENDLVRIADNQKAFDAGRKTERVADIALMAYGGYKLAGSLCGKLAGFLSSHAIGGFTISGGGAAALEMSQAVTPEMVETIILTGEVAGCATAMGSSSFDIFGKDAQVSVGGGSASSGASSEPTTWQRNIQNIDELDVEKFKNLQNNGTVKVNSSGSNRPLYSEPNSFYSTANGEHVFVYDENGKLIYDLSSQRIKGFNINVNSAGEEFFQSYKLKPVGEVPTEIKELFGW